MRITEEEKRILAQFYFEKCFSDGHYSICGISDFYKVISPNRKNLYENGEDDKLSNYNDLRLFHVVDFNILPESTYNKLLVNTENVFLQMGYIVDKSKFIKP